LRLAEGLVAAGRGADEARFELARCNVELAWDEVWRHHPDQGLAVARRAEVTLRELVAKAPSETRYLEGLGICLWSTDLLLHDKGLLAESLEVQEESLATYQKLADAPPEGRSFQNNLAIQHKNIARTYWKLGQQDAAFASMRWALAIWRKEAEAY